MTNSKRTTRPNPLTVEIFPRFGPKTAQNREYLDSQRRARTPSIAPTAASATTEVRDD